MNHLSIVQRMYDCLDGGLKPVLSIKRSIPVKCGLPCLLLNQQKAIRNSKDAALLLLHDLATIDLQNSDGSTALI